MKNRTRVLEVDPLQPDPAAIGVAAGLIASGRLVAFPTETVYGLGANALDREAVDRIFAAKQRPIQDPLIVHLAEASQLERVAVGVPPVAWRLAERFWPGALTLVLQRGPDVAPNVAAGRRTVAVRVPAHPVAQALLERCGLPIAAPSANLFSRPSPTAASHVLADLNGRIDLLLDGGAATIGLESSVVDLTRDPPRLLRPGGVPAEALRRLLPDLQLPEMPSVLDPETPAVSPGTLLKHYSPRAMVVLLRGPSAAAAKLGRDAVRMLRPRGIRVGVLVPDEEVPLYAEEPVSVMPLGPGSDAGAVAHALFARIRDLDASGVDVILAREISSSGLGLAVCDRLFRAAEGRVLDAAGAADLESLFVGIPAQAGRAELRRAEHLACV